MESSIRKILVPSDFSAASQRAVDYARVIAAGGTLSRSGGPHRRVAKCPRS
jgi:nucleotide-binding universal stress UspA family protein